MKLLTKCFTTLTSYLVPLRPKHSPQRPILKHRQPSFFPQYERQLMHIATRKEIIGLTEDAVFTDYRTIGVTYRPTVSTAAALNVSPNKFRILASYVSAPPTVIILRTKTCTSFKRSTRVFDTVGGEVIRVKRQRSLRAYIQNAYFYYFYLIIFEWRCRRWFRESVETSRIYS